MEFVSRGQCGAYCASDALRQFVSFCGLFFFLLSETINGRRLCPVSIISPVSERANKPFTWCPAGTCNSLLGARPGSLPPGGRKLIQ